MTFSHAGNFLWRAANANLGLVSVISQLSVFAPALEAALRGRSLSGTGLVQLMTCDHPRQVEISKFGISSETLDFVCTGLSAAHLFTLRRPSKCLLAKWRQSSCHISCFKRQLLVLVSDLGLTMQALEFCDNATKHRRHSPPAGIL